MRAPSAPELSAAERRRQAEYAAQDDLRTLTQADEIRRDSGRRLAAQRVLNKQQRALGRSRRMGGRRGRR